MAENLNLEAKRLGLITIQQDMAFFQSNIKFERNWIKEQRVLLEKWNDNQLIANGIHESIDSSLRRIAQYKQNILKLGQGKNIWQKN